MTTWHQAQAAKHNPTPLYRAEKWAVVETAKGSGFQSRSLWDSAEEADAHCRRMLTSGNCRSAYVLPPTQPRKQS
jgi:hypothetical protein